MFFDFFKTKKSDKNPYLITGSEFGAAVEHMLHDANKFITLVSPYIKFNSRILDILQQKREANVIITIIYREDFDNSSVAEFLYKRNNLHAKCYITENSFLIGSMNLYDYSQINNDELGVLIHKNDFPVIYEHCYKEVERLAKNYNMSNNRQINKSNIVSHSIINKKYCEDREKDNNNFIVNCKYSYLQIKEALNFNGDIKGGINQICQNKILLIMRSNSKYENRQIGDIIYFVGQNTGGIEQKIIYGNKALYDAYENQDAKIYLFKDNFFYGEVYVCDRPYVENGKLIYPLKRSDKYITQENRNKEIIPTQENSNALSNNLEFNPKITIRGVDIELKRDGSNSKSFFERNLTLLIPALNENELDELQQIEFCKRELGLGYPLLEKDWQKTKDRSGRSRYYSKKICGYYICSQWYPQNFEKWERYLKNLSRQ